MFMVGAGLKNSKITQVKSIPTPTKKGIKLVGHTKYMECMHMPTLTSNINEYIC